MSLADLIAGKPAPASVAKIAGIAVAKPGEMQGERLSHCEPLGVATAIVAIPATATLAGKPAPASVAKIAGIAVANPAERKSAKPTTAREPAIEAVPVVSKRKSAETIQPTPQPESVNALLSGAVATATFATLATQGHTEPLPGGGVATAIVAIPATATLATDATLTAPVARSKAGLHAALAEAAAGLPVTLAELIAAFGEEGAADWLEGYEPHCHPRFLRAFARAVAERLERERAEAPSPPGPLDGWTSPRIKPATIVNHWE